MGLESDIEELLSANVISDETAVKMRKHYAHQKGDSSSRIFAIFGVLGATLVGLGIILIIAHNWDDFNRTLKTALAFVPLILGQGLCFYALISKQESPAWRESSASFLFIAVGSSIALISQVYNIMGNLSEYILTWMLLCVPLVYLLRSSMASLFYIVGITSFAMSAGYGGSQSVNVLYYWPLLMVVFPHYYQLYQKGLRSNFLTFHSWFIAISLVISLATLGDEYWELMLPSYVSLFGVFYLLGQQEYFRKQSLRNNSFLVTGFLGTVYLLLFLSFNEVWDDIYEESFLISELVIAPEFYSSIILSTLAGFLLFKSRSISTETVYPINYIFLLFIPIFLIGTWLPFSFILINILTLIYGIWIIRLGAQKDHLGQLNMGLVIIALLITCRFFDTDLSFVIRGVLFVLVGLGFFVSNYWMIKRRRKNEI